MLGVQYLDRLETSKSQVSRLYILDRSSIEMIGDDVNFISTKVVEFHHLKVKAIIQALPLRHCYIGEIDLTNITSGNKMSYMSLKNNNNYFWKDYDLPIKIINIVDANEHTKLELLNKS